MDNLLASMAMYITAMFGYDVSSFYIPIPVSLPSFSLLQSSPSPMPMISYVMKLQLHTEIYWLLSMLMSSNKKLGYTD